MHDLRDLRDLILEKPKRIRVGHHHAGGALANGGAHGGNVYAPTCVARDLDDVETHEIGRRGVGSVR